MKNRARQIWLSLKIKSASLLFARTGTLGKQNRGAEFRHQLQLWGIFCTLMARLNMNNPFYLYVCIQQCVYGRVCVCVRALQ